MGTRNGAAKIVSARRARTAATADSEEAKKIKSTAIPAFYYSIQA